MRRWRGRRDGRNHLHFGTNSHGARPVHLIITMIKWIRTSRLSIENSLSLGTRGLASGLEAPASPGAVHKPIPRLYLKVHKPIPRLYLKTSNPKPKP